MRQPYTPIDNDGNHILEALQEHEYEDPTLKFRMIMQREGVSIEVEGRDPNDGAALMEHLYLKTRHLPGYAQCETTMNLIVKEAELARLAEVEGATLQKHFKRVAAIKKTKAIQAVRSGK